MSSCTRWLILGMLLAGCQGPVGQRGAFPATWPGSQALGAKAPTVQVIPIVMAPAAIEGPEPTGEGLPTAAVLSALFVKHLHVNGVHAVLELPDDQLARYVLRCRVPTLNYEMTGNYPPTRTYRAELACELTDPTTEATIWQRKLNQQYDKTVLLDLMTKLPAPMHGDDRTMYQECIVPLWDAMAQSVGTVVRSREQWLPAVEPAGEDLQLGLNAR